MQGAGVDFQVTQEIERIVQLFVKTQILNLHFIVYSDWSVDNVLNLTSAVLARGDILIISLHHEHPFVMILLRIHVSLADVLLSGGEVP